MSDSESGDTSEYEETFISLPEIWNKNQDKVNPIEKSKTNFSWSPPYTSNSTIFPTGRYFTHWLTDSKMDHLNGYEVPDEEEEEEEVETKDYSDINKDDLYAMLGLIDKRYKATTDEIQKAYRERSKLFHPDKQGGDESYFKALTKAVEMLTDKTRRIEWDSVDPAIVDDSFPSLQESKKMSPEEWMNIWSKVFERNQRFSKKKVPLLGDLNQSIAEVEKFYELWTQFDSWRIFAFNDPNKHYENCETREERRYQMRENETHRKKLKKKENARMIELVDTAYASDPRLLAEKARKKEAKEMKKRKEIEAKLAAARSLEERKKEAELKKKQEEEATKLAKANAKKEKENARKIKRNAKKNFKEICANKDFWFGNDASFPSSEVIAIVSSEAKVEDLLELNEKFNISDNGESGRALLIELYSGLRPSQPKLEFKKIDSSDNYISKPKKMPAAKTKPVEKQEKKEKKNQDVQWTDKEIKLLNTGLIKFPPGTKNRWERLSNHIGTKNESEVLKKTKSLSSVSVGGGSQKGNVKSFDVTVKDNRLSTRDDVDIAAFGKKPESLPWTNEEQKLLETCLREIPSGDPTRWVKIAERIPTRTKKEVVARFKELARKAHEAKVTDKESSPSSSSSGWTDAEKDLFKKALIKFPVGIDGRWNKIASHIGKERKETQAMFKAMKKENLL